MLVTHPLFRTFTDRPIAVARSTQVLVAIQVDSRADVDRIIQLALQNGGRRYRDSADHGWMYYDCFTDPDGHQWEVMFIENNETSS